MFRSPAIVRQRIAEAALVNRFLSCLRSPPHALERRLASLEAPISKDEKITGKDRGDLCSRKF